MSSAQQQKHSHLLILGDFNYPEIEWTDGPLKTKLPSTVIDFLDTMDDAFLTQHVKFPTRYRQNQKSHTLDLIFTNEPDMIENITPTSSLGKSDHICITFQLKCYAVRHTSRTVKYLSFKDKDAQESWTLFSEQMEVQTKKHIPQKHVNSSRIKRPLWLDQATLRKVRKKDKMWKRYHDTEQQSGYPLTYAKARNQARWDTRRAKKSYERKIASNIKTHPKMFWQGVPDLEDEQARTVTDDNTKADLLNKFFTSTFTNEDVTHIPALP